MSLRFRYKCRHEEKFIHEDRSNRPTRCKHDHDHSEEIDDIIIEQSSRSMSNIEGTPSFIISLTSHTIVRNGSFTIVDRFIYEGSSVKCIVSARIICEGTGSVRLYNTDDDTVIGSVEFDTKNKIEIIEVPINRGSLSDRAVLVEVQMEKKRGSVQYHGGSIMCI